MKKLLLPFFCCICISSYSQTLLDSLLQQVGGKKVWVSTKMLHLQERLWFQQFNEPVVQDVWIDLERPRVRYELKSESLNRVRAFTKEGGWGQLEDGSIYDFTPERLAGDIEEWSKSIYKTYHDAAQGKDYLVVKKTDNNAFEVQNREGDLLSSFMLDANQRILKWKVGEGENIYGPTICYGNFSMPKWGAQIDGSFRFELVEINAVKDPSTISFLKPNE